MKKYLIGGFLILHLINNEVLSWIVLAITAWIFFIKIVPQLLEGTK